MKLMFDPMRIVRTVVPTRAVALLMAVGFVDLFATVMLHANGSIVELNPLMKPLIEQSEWAFAIVKSLTLFAAWFALAWYAKQNLGFVRRASLIGSAVYVLVWCAWFVAAA